MLRAMKGTHITSRTMRAVLSCRLGAINSFLRFVFIDLSLIIHFAKNLIHENGFHIHEFGDISRPDGQAAGGHFNPHNHEHNGPESLQRHVGDLGNIEADNYGYAYYEAVDPQMSFSGKASVIGRAVIIHANDDDLTTQPTGDAGGRVGQGVIGISKH